jgi:hypothetical protein
VRPLVIGDEERAVAKRIVDYAARRDHWYRSDRGGQTPGDNPEHHAVFWTYSCVFSYSVSKGDLYRHLSVRVPGKNLPNPFAVMTLAELFGFSGWDQRSSQPPKEWQIGINDEERTVVVLQKIAHVDTGTFEAVVDEEGTPVRTVDEVPDANG